MIDRIRGRRAALAAQLAQAQQQHAELEATLKALDRSMCAMHGGLQELDALLAGQPRTKPCWKPPHDQYHRGAALAFPVLFSRISKHFLSGTKLRVSP